MQRQLSTSNPRPSKKSVFLVREHDRAHVSQHRESRPIAVMVRFHICLLPYPLRAALVAQTVKSLPAIQDPGSISGLGRSPGEGNSNPLHYSCLENPMDRGAWWATVHRVSKSWTRLRDFHFLPFSVIQFMGLCPVKTYGE